MTLYIYEFTINIVICIYYSDYISKKKINLYIFVHSLHISQQFELLSSKLSISNLRTAFLKLIRLGKFLIPSFSFVHSLGPKYRKECLPYLVVLNLGKLKSLFSVPSV